ncbi:MAG TPA: hypothetical protein VGC41_03635, partial [Kofleriaceae bacterium]
MTVPSPEMAATREPETVPARKIVVVVGALLVGIVVFAFIAWHAISRPRIAAPVMPNSLLDQSYDLVPADAVRAPDPRID